MATRQIENAADMGDGDLEARALRRRLADNARDLDARVLLARLYAQRGYPDLALEHYRLAEALFPDSTLVSVELATTLHKLGALTEALSVVERGLRSHSEGSWELFSLRGIIQDEQGQFGPAETSHRSALKVNQTKASLHNNLGYNLLLQHRPSEAENEFRTALELAPRSDLARNNLAAAILMQARPIPAAMLAEMEKSAGPEVAHNNLAAILLEQGKYSEAREEIETALRLHRNYLPALANLKLVSERDGGMAALPPFKERVSFWRQVASTWSKVIGSKSNAAAPEQDAAETGKMVQSSK